MTKQVQKFAFYLKMSLICGMGKMKLNRIKEVMATKGVKSAFVAHAIGKDASTFSGYYNNNRQPPLMVLCQIALALNVPPYELVVSNIPDGVKINKPILINEDEK